MLEFFLFNRLLEQKEYPLCLRRLNQASRLYFGFTMLGSTHFKQKIPATVASEIFYTYHFQLSAKRGLKVSLEECFNEVVYKFFEKIPK